MLQRFRNDTVTVFGWGPSDHGHGSCAGLKLLLCMLAVIGSCKVYAQEPQPPATESKIVTKPQPCLSSGDGFLRARMAGIIQAELDWGNELTECTGAVRPDGGIRMVFSHQGATDKHRMVIVFGIAQLREGSSANAVPVNVTVMREGAGEFYSTQGDDKCMLDEVTQQPIVGIPNRSRSYRVVARGFCTEPARAVRGKGAVLLSRFDYAGRVDYNEEAESDGVTK